MSALEHLPHVPNQVLMQFRYGISEEAKESLRGRVADVVDCFDSAEASGKPLDAIVITQAAKASDSLWGIITIHDMPKVLRLLAGNHGSSASAQNRG